MNICLCGTESGYPHKDNCPFPYFGKVPAMIKKWKEMKLAGQSSPKCWYCGEVISPKQRFCNHCLEEQAA